MAHKKDANTKSVKTNEIKQAFLSNAISDIAIYIQLADTKVSIIMGALVALIAGILACYEPISQILSNIKPCSWLGVSLIFFILVYLLSTVGVFVFGISTIRGHVSTTEYKSKWFLPQPPKEYPFDVYKRDLQVMNDEDVIENMGAELYKLNDINRQKAKTMKWAIRSFAMSLAAVAVIGLLLLISLL